MSQGPVENRLTRLGDNLVAKLPEGPPTDCLCGKRPLIWEKPESVVIARLICKAR